MYYSPVVRVFTTQMETCFDIPWQTKRSTKGTGSGVYLGGNEILTGAHVVHNATFIQLQKLTSPEKVVAKVISICHDCDLALLSVEDNSFFSDLEPAQIGKIPELRDPVEVVGFPMGGEQVSITNGVVSRIEVSFYSHSWREFLCATIDAAVNPGNSGGPVFNQEGQVVGIAFQKNSNAENSGQMVPTPMIETFLRAAQQGQAEVSLPSLGIYMQTLENPTLRQRFSVPEGESGVLVNSVDFGSSSYELIQPGDVIHQVDEYSVSNMGTILYRNKYRTRIVALLSERLAGDVVTLKRRRDGIVEDIKVTLKPNSTLAPREEGIENRYFIYAGLVFQPLSRKYLQTWKRISHAPAALRFYYSCLPRSKELLEPVVLSQVLSDEVNVGYEDFYYEIISEVNGERIKSLDHLASILENADGQVEMRTIESGWVVIDGQKAQNRGPQILERYHIPQDRKGVNSI